MSKYPKNYTPVDYYVPGRKRKLCGSTKFISNYLTSFHNDNPTFTIKQLRELITDRSRYIFMPEAVEVLDAHIEAGYGDFIPAWK